MFEFGRAESSGWNIVVLVNQGVNIVSSSELIQSYLMLCEHPRENKGIFIHSGEKKDWYVSPTDNK